MSRPRARSAAVPGPSPADLSACEQAIRTGSKSFHAASLLLPGRVRAPSYALYAFCRLSDDAVDLAEGGAAARAAAVKRLERRLDALYAGRPEDAPADRALGAVVSAYDMPRALPAALLEGLAWDAEGRRYETLDALTDYAARVAGAVGAMMAVLMEERSPDMVARACDLGVAMQLTNIARDVGEDARAGRIYLPLAWMREEGVAPEAFLADPRFSPGLARVVSRLLSEADALYRRAEPGVARLPIRCRPAIYAARYLYDAIGRTVAAADCDSVSERAVVPRAQKRRLLAFSTLAAARPATFAAGLGVPTGLALPPLRATRYLVDAIVEADAVKARAAEATGDSRIERVLDMFERLHQRDAKRRATPRPEA